jgi:hypothetical protein
VIEQNFESALIGATTVREWVLPDSRDVHDCWRQPVVVHEVRGVRVHDARLAASMDVHGVMQLPTVDVRDHAVPRITRNMPFRELLQAAFQNAPDIPFAM